MQKREKRTGRVSIPLKMLSVCWLMLCCCVWPVAADVLADAKPITIVNRSISVREALDEVKKQSGISLMYKSDIIDKEIRLNLNLKDATLKEALEAICSPAGLQYVSKEDYVLITRKQAAVVSASRKEVTGVVMDEKGEPLIGVAIQVEGDGTVGGVTDINGRYRLKVRLDDRLIFSYVGMRKYVETPGVHTRLDVVMREDSKLLSDVVVTGYQTISRERATGAFDIINQDVLDKPSANITDRLVGKVAGVQASLAADGSATFTIRGRGTLQSDQEPLVVVDGFPLTSGFEAVNPNDVETISILKDAAAASIWGARASNGVIVITTKTASKGKGLHVEFGAQCKIGNEVDWDYRRNMLSSAESVAYQKSMFGMVKESFPVATPETADAFRAAYETSRNRAGLLYGRYRNGSITEAEYNAGLEALSKLDNTGQIKDKVLRRPVYQQYNISLSGATAKMSNFVSLLYGSNKSCYRDTSDDNLQADYRGTATLTKWLDVNLQLSARFRKHANASSSIGALSPYDMLLNEDGSYADMSYLKYYPDAMNYMIGKFAFPYSDWSYNPLKDTQYSRTTSKTLNNRLQLGMTFKIMEGLTFDTKFLYEHLQQDGRTLHDEASWYVRNMVNTYTTLNWTTGGVTQHIDNGAILQQTKSVTDAYNWRNQVNFNRTFAEKHAINFVGGVEINQSKYRYTKYAPVYGYSDKYLTSSQIKETTVENCFGKTVENGILTMSGFSYTLQRYFSAFANLSYTFDGKYSISGSYRTDASNFITDDPSYRYAPFWSVGLGWNLSNEAFIEPFSWIDYLKPRITYGCNGNANTSTSVVPLITMSGMNSMINEYGAKVATFGNPTMRWERTHVVNLGVDFSFMGGKLYGKLDVYNKKGTDIMANVSVPIVAGMYKLGDSEVKITTNAAEITNRGFEMELGSTLHFGEGFTWNGNVNMAYNKNKVDKFYVNYINPYDMHAGYYPVEDYSIYGLWAYEYAGLIEEKTASGTVKVPAVYIDKDGTKAKLSAIPSGTDGRDMLSYMGTTVAPWTVGMNQTFTYRNFDFSFTMTGKFGHKFRKTSFNFANPHYDIPNKQYYQVLGADPETRLALPDNDAVTLNYYAIYEPIMTYNVASANHVRMQEMTLSYSLPAKVLSKWNIERLTFYLQGNNLFTIKATGEDPEFTYGSWRLQPTYTVGAKFAF